MPLPSFRTVLELKPGPGNPRNSEGAFATLADGRLLFAYSRYNGDSAEDHGAAVIAAITSEDGGLTWSKPRILVEQEGRMNVMSVSLQRLPGGELALFYLRKNGWEDCLPLVRFSRDDGVNWSGPLVCIVDQDGYFVLNNDRVIALADESLLFPVARHDPVDGEFNPQGRIFAYRSTDQGRNWVCGAEIPNPGQVLLQEPGVVELSKGTLLMVLRTDCGCQYFSRSEDGGLTWSPVQPGTLPSPLGSATIKRLPGSATLLAVWNDNDGSRPAIAGKRTPLVAALSHDNARTWVDKVILEDDPEGWYSYIALHFPAPGQVLLAHTAGHRPAVNPPPEAGLEMTRIVLLTFAGVGGSP